MKSRRTPTSDSSFGEERIVQCTVAYTCPLFRAERLEISWTNGRTARRDIVRHPGGAAIVARDGDDVVLVRQFRVALGRTMLELPAGKIEPGEDPLAAAQRELDEETGCQAAVWHALGVVAPSPGFLDETLHLFFADGVTCHKAHPDPDEYVTVVRIPFAEALAEAEDGRLQDAKTIIGLCRAARYWAQTP